MTFNLFFNLLVLIAIVADFFFHTDTVGIIALGALPMTTNLSSFFPKGATTPDFTAFPFEHDFVLDGIPQSFARNGDGSLVIARGAEVITRFGLGYVERRHIGGSYIVRIVEFDDTLEVPVYADPTEVNAFGVVKAYRSATEEVGILSNLYNARMLERSEFFSNRMNDNAYAEELLDMLVDADCYEVSISGGDYCGATEFMFKRAINPIHRKRSSAETRAYRARMKALADKMLEDAEDNDVVPDDIAAELADVFGE